MTQTADATDVNTAQCSTCGADIRSQAEFCPECGTRQPSLPDAGGDDTSLVSAAASIPVPGLGQMINRQFGRGFAFMIAFFGGYYLLNTIFGGVLNFILFGVWGYAIYDAYKKPSLTGGQSDGYEKDQRGATAGATDNSGRHLAASESKATTTTSSATASTDSNVSNGEHGSPSTRPNNPNVVSDRMSTADSATTDSGANADSEATAESTVSDDGVDDIGERDSPNGYGEPGDDDDEDSESKWSHDDSDSSWSRD